MNNEQIRIMAETFCIALESMAFITSMPADEPYIAPDQPMLVRVGLTGPGPAGLELVAGRPFARQLASNLLGVAAEDAQIEQHCADALKELLNVTAGGFINANMELGGDAQEIGIPQLVMFDPEKDWVDFIAAPETIVLDAEGNTVAIRLKGAA
jgi:chemotaxis phosphatase CheX-like protein